VIEMRKASVLSVLVLSTILATLLPAKAAAADPTPVAPNARRAKAMALHVTAALQAMAEKEERDGHACGPVFRSFASKAGLNSEQTDALGRAAAHMREQVAPLDERASAIIQAARNLYPGGRLPAGVTPPPPPPELHELKLQRERIVNQALEELEVELGSEAMAKLGTYTNKSMTAGAQRKRIVRTPGAIGPIGLGALPSSQSREVTK
jgi:hypothetical protein